MKKVGFIEENNMKMVGSNILHAQSFSLFQVFQLTIYSRVYNGITFMICNCNKLHTPNNLFLRESLVFSGGRRSYCTLNVNILV